MDKLDFKKENRNLYLPKTTPTLVEVPEMQFIMIDGKGDPNIEDGEYTKAVTALYALSFAIKMSKMGNDKPTDYFEYVVPPLEGLWWARDNRTQDFSNKDLFCWISMIRQPAFVTQDVFDWACGQVRAKKPDVDISGARFAALTEGLCVQCMHIGSYDSEAETIAKMNAFIAEKGYQTDISDNRRHHEIYISDPRKVADGKRQTVIRHPIRKQSM